MNLQGVLEGLLFAAGDEGLTLEEMVNILKLSEPQVKELLKTLKIKYNNEECGINIAFLGESFKLTTKKEHKEYLKQLIAASNENSLLSQAALETLAIIAYHQPITRMEVDELRGVNNYMMLRKLLAKGLIKEAGKSTLPGKPNLYRTTKLFLDYFGLASLNDLPEVKKNQTAEEQTELFTSIYKEEHE